MEMDRLAGIVEGLLFALGDAVEIEKLAKAIQHDEETTRKILIQLKEKYQKEDRGICLLELENAVQLCTKPSLYEYLIRYAKQPKKHILTEVVLETLAIIAYKQPVTKIEIEKIRGVKSDHAVNKLIEYDLVTEVGRLDGPGKPILFGTTREFLRRFGLSSLEELPHLDADRMEDFRREIQESQMKLDV